MKITKEEIEDAASSFADNTIASGDPDFLLEVGFTAGADYVYQRLEPLITELSMEKAREARPVQSNINNLPTEIFLNIGTDEETEFKQMREVTWAANRAHDSDIRYVLDAVHYDSMQKEPVTTLLVLASRVLTEEQQRSLAQQLLGRLPQPEVMSLEDWTTVHEDGMIHVPDELDPLINKIGNQLLMHTVSGKSEPLTVCHIAFGAQKFFHKMYSGKSDQLEAELSMLKEERDRYKQKLVDIIHIAPTLDYCERIAREALQQEPKDTK